MGEIVGASKLAADFVAEIASASQEQSASVRQVNETVAQLEGMTQKNASMVEMSTASLTAVDKQAQEIMQVVSFFAVGDRTGRNRQPASSGGELPPAHQIKTSGPTGSRSTAATGRR